MATVTALLDLRIKPESVAEAKETVESVLVATRAFPGCIGVDVLVDTEDEAHLLLIEKWESIEHDQAYRDWRATDAGASALSTIVAVAEPHTIRCRIGRKESDEAGEARPFGCRAHRLRGDGDVGVLHGGEGG